MTLPGYSFVFVCQRGDLEGLALVLAASLRRHLRCPHELIAAIPAPVEKWGMPVETTMRLLEQMNARIEYFENHTERTKKGDALTNKIHCFGIKARYSKTVFIDSDIICLREFSGDERFAKSPFNAAPTFKATGRNWDRIYRAVDMEAPAAEMMTLFSDEMQPPYFNSGLVAINTELAAQFYQDWLECFRRIDESGAMDDNLYFREQASMSVAVIKSGLDYDVLDERFNFWVRARPIDADDPPFFLHHTWPHPPEYKQDYLRDLVGSLVEEYPGMSRLVSGCRWKYYIRPKFMVAINRFVFNLKRKRTKKKKKPTNPAAPVAPSAA